MTKLDLVQMMIGNVELVKMLLNAGADVDAPPAKSYRAKTALQAAAERGNVELVGMLLDAGANVNAPPAADDGRTVLNLSRDHVSSLRKRLSVAIRRTLLRVGITATGKNSNALIRNVLAQSTVQYRPIHHRRLIKRSPTT